MAKQVMDIQNSHGISQGESDENQRNWTEKQWENKLQISGRNYDYTRRNLNFEIVDGKVQKIDTSKSIDQKMREMCAGRGMRWPNDPNPRLKPGADNSKVKKRNVAACFVFEGSRERMHEIAFGGYGVVDLSRGADNSHVQRSPEIEQWALDTYNWVGRKFGFENIAGFYVHLDETNPHIHCDVLPVATVKGKERVSYNKVFGAPSKVGNQEKWRAFHDSYYEEVGSKWGLDRGDDIQVTGAKHRTYEQYQEDLRKDIKKCETKIKGLTSMIYNLENRQNDLQVEISYLEHDVDVNQEAIDKKRQELETVQSQLNEKKTSLDDAQQQLQELKKEIGDKNEEVKQLSASIYSLRSDLQELQEQHRTLTTKVKGLTTMVNNLTSQLEDLKNDKNTTEEELSVVQGKLEEKQEKLEVANEQLKVTQLSVEALSEELSQLEEKRVSLTEGVTNFLGAQLFSLGNSISRKVKGKDDKIREETRKEVMKGMTAVSGDWRNGKIPTPEEYAKNYKYYKELASQKTQEVETLKQERQKLVAKNQELQAKVNKNDTTARGDSWLLSELLRCPDKQLWNDLRVFTNDYGWRCTGTYAGIPFNRGLPGKLEDNSLSDILTSFDYSKTDAIDFDLRFAISQLWMAFAGSGVTGGGGGGNNELPKKRDNEDNLREDFSRIFAQAKAKIKPARFRSKRR